jgi:hypothetical protein
MKNGMSAQAGFAAHAAGSRLHAGQPAGHGFCAYPWHVAVDTSRAGSANQNSMVITTDTTKLRTRWPQETSP